MAMEHGPFEDVFPIEDGDFPASHVFLFWVDIPSLKRTANFAPENGSTSNRKFVNSDSNHPFSGA